MLPARHSELNEKKEKNPVEQKTLMNEFEIIKTYFCPLAKNFPGALSLLDDAALLEIDPDHQMVITTDLLTAGVHFFENDPADFVARKSIRVNLSDLAAMGAEPLVYL